MDALLRRLAAARDGLVVPLARAAGLFVERSGWFDCGFARAGDFARERLGRSGRWLHDLAALDERFHRFPSLARAASGLDGGPVLGRVAALIVSRLARDGDIDAWIAEARRCSVRRLRQVLRHACGDLPPDCEPETVPVALAVPGAVRLAFEEVLSLHRANVGREVGVPDFIEALVGETATAVAGVEQPHDPAAMDPAPGRALPVWPEADPAAMPFPSPAVRAALDCLATLETAVRAVSSEAGLADLVRALETLAHVEDCLEVHMGELLAAMGDVAGWKALGYAGAAEYGEERLRLSRTVAWRRESLSRNVTRLRHVQAAYRSGELGFEAAQILVRILGRNVSADLQQRWIAHARAITLKRLRDEETMALRARLLETRTPLPADDATWHATLERQPGRSRDRVLGSGLDVLGKLVRGEPDFTVFLRLRLSPETAALFQPMVERVRARLMEKPQPTSPAEAARALPSLRIAWHLRERDRHVPDWVGFLAMLEEYVLTWDDEQGMPDRRAAATYGLGGYRCMGPGCTGRRHLERHHIGYRSHRTSDEPENLVCLCRMHHQEGEHQGRAELWGQAPLGIRWRLGRPAVATYFHNERWCERQESPREVLRPRRKR